MRVFTPVEIAQHAANKYLGVLVAAKYARALNEFPGGSASRDKKLTTRSLDALGDGVRRRRHLRSVDGSPGAHRAVRRRQGARSRPIGQGGGRRRRRAGN